MFCSTCGVALTQRMKYCNRCGTNLITTSEVAQLEVIEKRMDSEMEGLFWITVFGIGLIVGGMVLMKKVALSDWFILAYMFLSSTAFITYFGITVWQIRRLAKKSNDTKGVIDKTQVELGELNSANSLPLLEPVPSITDHTTRTLEPVSEDRARQ